jgi:hypothetical protein
MHVRAVEVEVLAVEEEPLVGGEREPAHAERGRLGVAPLAVHSDRSGEAVAVGAVGVPQLRLDDHARQLDFDGRAGWDGAVHGFEPGDRVRGVADDAGDADLDRPRFVVDDRDDGVHVGAFAVDVRGGDADAVPVDANPVGDDEADVAVDAAVEAEVPGPRCQARIPAVVHADEDFVLPGGDRVREVHGERGVAALVPPDEAPVDVDVGDLEDAEELQGDPFADPLRTDVDRASVAAVADVEPLLAEVGQVEGVRQTDVIPLRIRCFRLRARMLAVGERPVVVDEMLLADHAIGPLGHGAGRTRWCGPP